MRKRHSLRHVKGLSILELLITLTIASIIFSFVVPTSKHILTYSRVSSEINQASSIVQFARYTAINSHQKISVCPTQNTRQCDIQNWQLPLLVFYDKNRNQQRDPDEAILRLGTRGNKFLTLKGPRKLISFSAGGSLSSTATLKVCPTAPLPEFNRALYVSLNGRVRLSKDTNNDGIHDNGRGQQVSCS
ncbi:GspH/FimT family pseudopilin [Agaribacter flavus]|uniref:Type II secretion system protein H n=1 Tax=Agaribacter flavus TaxID=1902781 RepID=A0ABV7FRR1_9ALTE